MNYIFQGCRYLRRIKRSQSSLYAFTKLKPELRRVVEERIILIKAPPELSRRHRCSPVIYPGQHKKFHSIEALSHAALDGSVHASTQALQSRTLTQRTIRRN